MAGMLQIPEFAPPPDFMGQMSEIQQILARAEERRRLEARDAETQRFHQATENHWQQRDTLADQRQSQLDKRAWAKEDREDLKSKIDLARKGITGPGDKIVTGEPAQTPVAQPQSEIQQPDPWQETKPGELSEGASDAIDSELQGAFSSRIQKPSEIRGVTMEVPQPPKKTLVTRGLDGKEQTIDLSAMDEADRQERLNKLQTYQRMYAEASDPMMKRVFAEKIAEAQAGLGKEDMRSLRQTKLQDQKSTDSMVLEDKRQEGRLALADKNNAARMERALIRKRKASSAGFVAENKSLSQQLPVKEMNAIQTGFFRMARLGDVQATSRNIRRLEIAKEELERDPGDPKMRMAQLETWMNQFGVLRNGVPVKYEGDFVFHNSLLNKIKLYISGAIGKPVPQNILDEIGNANKILRDAYAKVAKDNLGGVKQQYDGFSQPARKFAQNLGNAVLSQAGMEPVQLWPDTPISMSESFAPEKKSKSLDESERALIELTKMYREAK